MTGGGTLELRLLGPLEAVLDGRPLALGGVRQRALLALLLLRANEVVPRDRVIEELWHDHAPETAANALAALVARLRRVLPAGVLVTRSGGYEARVEPAAVDVHRFERLVVEGNEALAAGDAAGAAERLRSALSLWRGPPLADLSYEPFAEAAIRRLEELRLAALESRIDADLALGRHADLTAELQSLLLEHPLRERLRGQLMLALYRSGRQAEALKVYREGRRILVDELGIDPSPALQELEQAILRQDRSVEAPDLRDLGERRPEDVAAPQRLDLPAGTVTFLFTDVEGSTRLLNELGAARYAEALAEQRRVIREACADEGGVEVDTQGDAFFVAFPTAPRALAAAGMFTDALACGPIRVRVGIHTGAPHVTDEGYVGPDVHRAARIGAVGHGGQVLVSAATASLVDVDLRDLGEHRLKDLSAPERVYQFGDGQFPPLRTLYRTNLPIPPAPIVGRERELEEAGTLVRSQRLLTLTGPGGSGKTRLALELAAEAVEQFPDGVFWVPLQALRDPALVERAIATSLSADDSLIEYVASKRLLVVLDNFEQVVEAAPTISSLLAGTPHAKVLVTSREPLHVESEQRYPVEPLPEEDAQVLFVERARALAPGFQATEAVGEICRRLDGLPLAIELAAAHVALLDPGELLARLKRRLPLLTSRSRDAPARQRTLRATIEWSYELLERDEQKLFRRLAVFRGSFSLAATEAVCDASLDGLESLLEKNLLRRWGSGRLGMLDTIREYALERLDASPEAEKVHRRHADFFLALMQDANLSSPKLDARKPMRFDVAAAEQDNVRAALAWTLRSGAIALGLELATAADMFWSNHDPNEGMRWFRRLFEHPEAEAVAPETRAHALCCYGGSTGISGDFDGAEPLWEQSLALFDQLGDEHGRAVLIHRLSSNAMVRGDLERARRLLEESHAIHARKTEPLTRAFRLAETTGALGAVARDAGDDERAYALLSESLSAARQSGVEWWEAKMLAELAALALKAGRIEEAETHARQSLAIAQRLRDGPGCVFGVGLLACLAAERGQPERAGRLWGAIEDKVAAAPGGGWQRHREACAARVGKAAGPDFEQGRADGRELTLDDAVLIALE